MADMLLYSASVEDLATVFCFLAFQDIKEDPKKTQNPVREEADVEQVPQSALQ